MKAGRTVPRRRTDVQAGGRAPPLELFPFLSIFVCVLGVLSFLGLLLTMMGGTNVQLSSAAAKGYKHAYRILCFEDGMVLVPPPATSLEPVLKAAKLSDVRAAELEAVQKQRERMRERLAPAAHDVADMAAPRTDKELLDLVREVASINEAARRTGTMYEEFFLFGIYPGGGTSYQRFVNALDQTPHADMRVGLEALDPGLQVSLDQEPGGGD